MKAVEIKKNRFKYLKGFLSNVKSIHDHAHTSCLERLGLMGMPRNHHESKRFAEIFDERITQKVRVILHEIKMDQEQQDWEFTRSNRIKLQTEIIDHLKKDMKIKHPTPQAEAIMTQRVKDVIRETYGKQQGEREGGENEDPEESQIGGDQLLSQEPDAVNREFNILPDALKTETVYLALTVIHSEKVKSTLENIRQFQKPGTKKEHEAPKAHFQLQKRFVCLLLYRNLFFVCIRAKTENHLENISEAPVFTLWNNLVSLMDIALQHRPTDSHEVTASDFIGPLNEYVSSTNLKTRRRNMQRADGSIITILYVKDHTAADVISCVKNFWEQFRDGINTCTATGSTAVAVALRPVVPSAELKRKRKKIPGTADLFQAVLAHMPKELALQHLEQLRTWLHRDFVCAKEMAHEWSIFWPKNNGEDMLTFMDVEQDPIIAVLGAWLTKRLDDWIAQPDAVLDPAPSYPVTHLPDPRPIPPVPSYLQEIMIDEVYVFHRSHDYFFPHSRDINGVRVDLTKAKYLRALSPERCRQWKRITEGRKLLRYTEIASCLGWADLEHDEKNIMALTEFQMIRNNKTRSFWLEGRSLWRIDVCMPMMRIGACFMEQMTMRRIKLTDMHSEMRRAGALRVPYQNDYLR